MSMRFVLVAAMAAVFACQPKAAPSSTDVAPARPPAAQASSTAMTSAQASAQPSARPSVETPAPASAQPSAQPSALASAQHSPGPSPSALAALHADTGVSVTGLASYCAGSSCDRYEVALQRIREQAMRARDAGTCTVAQIGTCGSLRYLEEAALLGTVRFYDASGALVAVMQDNMEHPGQRWSGPRQTCRRMPKEDLCKPAARDSR